MISLSIDDVDTIEMELEEFYRNYNATPVTTKCSLCRATETAPKRDLELKGWALYGKAAYCPSH